MYFEEKNKDLVLKYKVFHLIQDKGYNIIFVPKNDTCSQKPHVSIFNNG